MNPYTPDARDAGLRRLRHANRWLIAGSVGLTGIFTGIAAEAFPGKTLKPAAAGTAAAATTLHPRRARRHRAASASSPQTTGSVATSRPSAPSPAPRQTTARAPQSSAPSPTRLQARARMPQPSAPSPAPLQAPAQVPQAVAPSPPAPPTAVSGGS